MTVNICPQENKHSHPSKGKAEAQLRSILKREPEYTGVVYPCIYCKGYHVGRPKQSKGK